jgi:hypothetical protein
MFFDPTNDALFLEVFREELDKKLIEYLRTKNNHALQTFLIGPQRAI